jgi:hypothetical protein
MKRLLLVGILTVLAAGVLSAGTPTTSAGDWNLFWSMNGFGDFGVTGAHVASVSSSFFSGTVNGLGGAYFLSDGMALRVALGFMNDNETITGTAGETDITDMTFGINPALLWYFAQTGPVSAYWGPFVSYAMGSSNTTFTPSGGGTGSETDGSASQFGAGVVVGGQWWAFDAVSFAAEYYLGFTSTTGELTTSSGGTSTTTNAPDQTTFGIYSWAVSVNIHPGRM